MIATHPFGNTGHQSSRIIFGAAALGGMRQEKADSTIDMVRTAGINHFDTAASYGESELRLSDFLQGHRGEVFLQAKPVIVMVMGRGGASSDLLNVLKLINLI